MPKNLITYQHKGTSICVRRFWNRTELLFDERVVDCWKGIVEITYTLQGEIDGDWVTATLTPFIVGANMYLHVNNKLVTKAFKL